MKKLADYLVSFQDIDLSPLLGISKSEYMHLLHGPLYQYKDEKGEIKEFFMYLLPLNNPHLLDKIKTRTGTLVIFQPDAIFELSRRQFSVDKNRVRHTESVSFN
jgi:hypothetical protein